MEGVRVSLSSGEFFFVDASLEDVQAYLNLNTSMCVTELGGRLVNPAQVAQVEVARSIDTMHTPERLEVAVDG